MGCVQCKKKQTCFTGLSSFCPGNIVLANLEAEIGLGIFWGRSQSSVQRHLGKENSLTEELPSLASWMLTSVTGGVTATVGIQRSFPATLIYETRL